MAIDHELFTLNRGLVENFTKKNLGFGRSNWFQVFVLDLAHENHFLSEAFKLIILINVDRFRFNCQGLSEGLDLRNICFCFSIGKKQAAYKDHLICLSKSWCWNCLVEIFRLISMISRNKREFQTSSIRMKNYPE